MKRNPKVRWLIELLGVKGAQNSDYDVGHVTEGNRRADDSGIGREALRPDVVAENDDVTASWAVFVARKSAAMENWCAVEAEKSGTDKGCGEQLRIGAARQIHVIQPMGRDVLECGGLLPPNIKALRPDSLASNSSIHFSSWTIRSASGYGSGFSNTVFTTEKIAVFAPMPSAIAATAVMVKLGLFPNVRNSS